MKIKFMLFVIIILMISVISLTGCEDSSTTKSAVCYAIAPTSNSQGLNMETQLVQDNVYDTIIGQGHISVVVIDGNSEIVDEKSYELDNSHKNASKNILKRDARSDTEELVKHMKEQVANDAQVDYLAGLRMAVRSISSLSGYDSKTIIVMGTGLSTQGMLNFKNNLLSVEPDVVLDELEEKNEIPDFTGITVIWQQMGDVASPQQELSQSQRMRLEQIWKGIVERGGGSFEYNATPANPADTQTSYPAVDIVELPAEEPVNFDKTTFSLKAPVALTEEQVSFVKNEATYLNEDEAIATIQPIADYLIKNEQITILLAGNTAGDEDSDTGVKLSRDRADAVKNTLIQLGVAENRIVAIGLGSSGPWHVYGGGYEGSIASGNRTVVLLDAASDTAKNILNEH